ncbi:hypothetical protein KY333_01415 [Candidatus Woesearchaeota archaeon]|nr:hypothetical protein [Candidatus Woesearchaeota archaeon]
MLKRGLSLLLFLVLLSSFASAWSDLNTTQVYEGSSSAIGLLVDPSNINLTITDVLLNTTNVTITDASANGWQANWSAYQAHWYGNQIPPNMFGRALFEFVITVPLVNSDTNVTFLVMRINNDSSVEFENETITFLNDTSAPFIVSTNPANNSNVFSNGNHTISVDVNESESQIAAVTYSYCPCTANATNCTANATTINLTCAGNICNGTADFSSFIEGDYACYVVNATNNVGGRSSAMGRINFTGQPPQVTGLAPTTGSIYLVGDTVTIAANATDNQTSVDKVKATIAYPDGNTTTINLTKSGDRYSSNFVIPDVLGWYNVTFIANDTMNNINNTQVTQFKAVPVYNIVFSLNPTQVRQGRNVRAAGTVKLANNSDIPETVVAINVQGTETNRTLTNGSFSYTFSAPNNVGSYNIIVKVYAANGYNYSATKRLRVIQSTDSYTSGYGDDWEGGYSGVVTTEDAGVTEEPDPEPTPTVTINEDAGIIQAIDAPEATPEEVIDEILNKPGNQITGSAVGLGSGATIFALILLLLGVVTLGLANSKIRGHVHSFAKEKVGGKFKSKTKDPGFSDQEWEEYFKRLKED